MTIKVALIDDQTLVRTGISSLLSLSEKVKVIAEGDDGDRAVSIANEFNPDIFLMDIRMARMNGIKAIQSLRSIGINTCLLYTSDAADD